MDTTHRRKKSGPSRTGGHAWKPPTMAEIKASKAHLRAKADEYRRTCITTKYGQI